VSSPFVSKSFYELQAANRRKTALLLGAFLALFAVLGYGFDWYFGTGPRGAGYPWPIFSLVGLVFGGLSAMWSYYNGGRQVLSATGARPANPAVLEEKQLLNVVEEMCVASGLSMIPVYVVPDPDPNAFAVGRDPQHASIAVTQGLLQSLNREELQGVIGHELSHVRNLDIRTMTVVAALYGGIVLLSDMAGRSMRWGGMGGSRGGRGGRSRDGGGAGILFLVVWLLLILLAPILGQMMALAVSRSREFDADATSAEMTRNPLGLANALRKIDGATEPTRSIGRGAAHLCIADPLGRAVNQKEGGWSSMWGTHPPIRKRISLLESMAGVVTSGDSPSPPEARAAEAATA
jgi:heat shock protein HtpX